MTSEKGGDLIVLPMTVADFAQKTGRPLTGIIAALLKKGVVATRNQVLPPEIILWLAEVFDVPAVEPEARTVNESVRPAFENEAQGNTSFERLPVVVVVGHVDHGKTTLLDFIRKTRVAAREKGGITQHVGAYQAHTEHGDIVFVDTPGHEAFSAVRSRGISIADVAILVIGADNGVQPQTIEALEKARAAGIPLIVAINKIDRATPAQVEAVKADLAKHNLVPSEWGGDTMCAPISALKGLGIDELLEMVVFQAQVGGLTTYLDVPATGYVLESQYEKGRGAVATIIGRSGVMRIGDHFLCGDVAGKISSLRSFDGKIVKEAMPSIPVQVAGFNELPRPGDLFKVARADEVKKELSDITRLKSSHRSSSASASSRQSDEKAMRLIVKADTISTKDVLLASLERISVKGYRGIVVVSNGIGPINESDVMLAADTDSLILGLHVKVESKAARLATELRVVVKLFDVIYHLLESLEELVEQGRPVKMVTKKVGEALVLKVFDIKKLGIVAGARVVEGALQKNGTLRVYRNNRLVGSGPITSLQRDRSNAKEVRKGFECAFMIQGFTDWQVDDRADCYVEVKDE